MELTLIDHLIVLALFVLEPFYGVWKFQQLDEKVARGEALSKITAYKRIILMEWGVVAAILGLWAVTHRSLPELGFTFGLAGLTLLWHMDFQPLRVSARDRG